MWHILLSNWEAVNLQISSEVIDESLRQCECQAPCPLLLLASSPDKVPAPYFSFPSPQCHVQLIAGNCDQCKAKTSVEDPVGKIKTNRTESR